MKAKVHIRPRPIRVAFLIDEHEYWQPMLDAIFADCFGRWGGRFNLLVPCENGSIRSTYLPWLKLYDPDIIYSYVNLPRTEIALIREGFCPSFLVHHEYGHEKSPDQRAFRPSLPIQALGSLSVTIGASRWNPISPRQPITLLDVQYGQRPSQFIQENFGCCGQSLSPWPVANDMAEPVRIVTFAPAANNNPRIEQRVSEDIFTDENVLLDRISKDRNLIGLSQLSAWFCPRLEFRDHRWAESVNLVVGDSFVDRVIFWNGRSHLPVSLDIEPVTLKTSKEQLDCPNFFTSLLGIINNRLRVPTGVSSNTQFKLRSAALSQSDLDAVLDKFRSQDKRHFYSAEAAITLDSCVPNVDALKYSRWLVDDGVIFHGQDWHEIEFSGSVFRPPTIYPRHIRDVRPLPFFAGQGGWALDLDIERTLTHSRFTNVQQSWRLPLRLRMVDAFLKGYELNYHAPIYIPRATAHGLLGVFGFAEGQLPEITVPTDEAAFRTALCCSKAQWPFDRSERETVPGVVFDTRPSDKGRYLTALLERSGGIHHAAQIFLQQFWRAQFDSLGAATAAADDQLERIVKKLQRRLKGGTISAPEDWRQIARTVLAEAKNLRFPNRHIRFDKLTKDFESFRNEFWEKNQAGAPREEWDEEERRSLGESVQYLCQQGILYQGHEWRCPRCYNKNWVSIAALAQSMTCEVCNHVNSAPVTDPWHFKLDAYILQGLREHSMLSYVWCLRRLAERARESFLFLEPQELFYTSESADRRQPDAEIDLLTVADGIVSLCEIKASSRDTNIKKFTDVAKRLRPDIAVMAVMESNSSALSRRLSELTEALSGTGITAELIHLEDRDIDSSPTLPDERRVSVKLF